MPDAIVFKKILLTHEYLDIIVSCVYENLSQTLNFLFYFPLQMTEGKLCQVHLLDDRKLELLVQVQKTKINSVCYN